MTGRRRGGRGTAGAPRALDGGLPLDRAHGARRYPGFDTMAQSRHWDAATTGVVAPRVGIPVDLRFFTPREEALACALTDQLLGQREDPRVPVVRMIAKVWSGGMPRLSSKMFCTVKASMSTTSGLSFALLAIWV